MLNSLYIPEIREFHIIGCLNHLSYYCYTAIIRPAFPKHTSNKNCRVWSEFGEDRCAMSSMAIQILDAGRIINEIIVLETAIIVYGSHIRVRKIHACVQNGHSDSGRCLVGFFSAGINTFFKCLHLIKPILWAFGTKELLSAKSNILYKFVSYLFDALVGTSSMTRRCCTSDLSSSVVLDFTSAAGSGGTVDSGWTADSGGT